MNEAIGNIERHNWTVRSIGKGRDGIAMYVVHRPDPTVSTPGGYGPRSYFQLEQIFALSELGKLEMREAIAAAHRSTKYLTGEENMATKANTKSVARAASTKAPLLKPSEKSGKGTAKTKAPKATPPAPKAKAAKAEPKKRGYVVGTDPTLDLLHSYQDSGLTIERMTANAVVTLFNRIQSTKYENAIVNSTLSVYDKRIARSLGDLELINREKQSKIGVVYWANPDAKPYAAKATKKGA
ncbi:MAG: hypothetical protein ABIP75_09855 [Pyrinomonadaceae bacterium]